MSSNHGNDGHGPSTAHHTHDHEGEGVGKGMSPWILIGGVILAVGLVSLIAWAVGNDDNKKPSSTLAPAKIASVEDTKKVTPPPPAKSDKQGATPAPVPVDCNTLDNDTKFGICVLNDEDVRPDVFEDKEWAKVVRVFAPVVRAALDQFEGCHEAYVIDTNDAYKNALCQRALLCLTAPSGDEAANCWQTGTRTNTNVLVEIN